MLPIRWGAEFPSRKLSWTRHLNPILSLLPQLAVGVALSLSVGCGSDDQRPARVPVTGQVVYPNGQPLAGGQVAFRSIGMSPRMTARGRFGSDGKFQLQTFEPGDGAIPGEYEVIVVPDIPDDRGTLSEREYLRALSPIDERYKEFTRSGLRFTVTQDPAQNQFKVEVRRPRR